MPAMPQANRAETTVNLERELDATEAAKTLRADLDALAESEEIVASLDRHGEKGFRIIGARPTAIATIGMAGACLGLSLPFMLGELPHLLGPAAQQAPAKLEFLASLNATLLATLLGLNAFSLIPEAEKARQQAAQSEARRARDRQAWNLRFAQLDTRMDEVMEKLEVNIRQGAALTRGLAESAPRGAPRLAARNGEIANRRDAFGGASRGPADTVEPQSIQEARLERRGDGGYQVSALDGAMAASWSRLEPEHPSTCWRVYLPLARSRECLEMLIRFDWSLNHYTRVGAYLGRPLDLSKLEIRVIDAPPSGQTTVLFPQVGPDGALHTKVLQYLFADVATGRGRIAVAVKGPVFEAAVRRRDDLLDQARRIPSGALGWLLGDCRADRDGRVRPEAVARWLSQPMPPLGELVNWRPEWSENPDQF